MQSRLLDRIIVLEEHDEISFTVYGSPIVQPRQRHRIVSGAKPWVQNYTPRTGTSVQWKSDVKNIAIASRSGGIWDGPVEMVVLFYMPRPKNLYRKKDPSGPVISDKRPDLDNLIKSVTDALSGVLYRDDGQICYASAVKLYHEKEGRPRAEITLRQVGGSNE